MMNVPVAVRADCSHPAGMVWTAVRQTPDMTRLEVGRAIRSPERSVRALIGVRQTRNIE